MSLLLVQKRKELELAAQRAGQAGQVPVKSEGFPQAVQVTHPVATKLPLSTPVSP